MKKQPVLFMAALLLLGSCAKSKIDRKNPNYAKVDYDSVRSSFEPLPDKLVDVSSPVMAERSKLGKKLYFEKQLSVDGTISCNSCHLLDKYGVDNETTSPGVKGQRGERNSPTVYNAGLNISEFWDGRAKDLKEQAKGPILNPVEMAMPSEVAVVKKLKSLNGYTDMFKASFPKAKDPVTYDNMAEAIAVFEKNLLTPSRFDAYLKGNREALTDDEKEGLRTFMEVGCVSCHDGANIGGGSYQKIGAVVPYDTKDVGRFAVTKDEDDKFVFKVPSLRNIVKTAPYFSDGSIKTLHEAVTLMGRHQLGIDLKEGEIEAIIAFLNSLTGDLPKVSKM